ncbi:unnamed protein product [Urochloa humidicola]
MANSSRLEQLGLPPYFPNGRSAAANSKNNKKTNERKRKDADYDPLNDDTGEQDLFDDDIAKGSKGKSSKKTKKHASDAPDIGVKFRSRRWVYASVAPTTDPMPNKSISQPHASLAPSDIHVPPRSHPAVSQLVRPAEQDGGSDAIPQADAHNNLANRDGFDLHDGNNYVADGAHVPAQPVGDNQMNNEGEEVPWNRGTNMGHGLNRMNRSHRGKLPIVIREGQIRPLVPVIAAKYATEINIAVRNHVPVLTHWKEYKDRPAVIEDFLRILQAKFNIDINDKVVKYGCLEMMKSSIRNQRHRVKKEFFDPFPLHLVPKKSPLTATTDKDWLDLVEMWKTPKKMVACQKNKDNRGNVLLHQTTGSCSYPVFVEKLEDEKEDEDEDEELDAFDLFKMCHFSKIKNGYTPAVQSKITEMETQLAAQPVEGEQPKSAVQVVAGVLEQNNKKSLFLQNVGMQTKRPRMSAKLQAENAELRLIVSNQREQMKDFMKQVQENEQTRMRDKEEMSKKQAELEAKLELALGQNQPC